MPAPAGTWFTCSSTISTTALTNNASACGLRQRYALDGHPLHLQALRLLDHAPGALLDGFSW